MSIISERVCRLSPSATLAMAQKSAEMRAAGIDVISLAAGEPDFNTPRHIREAAKRAIDEGYSHYSPVAGYLSLREAISEKLRRENGLTVPPQCIVVGNGAKQELSNVFLTLVNPGDEVIIPTPAWVSYMEMAALAGGRTVEVACHAEEGFKLTPSRLREALSERTRVLVLNSPSNPTGAVYSAGELRGLAEVLRDFPAVTVVADEIYEHISYTGRVAGIGATEWLRDRTVIINGVSKAYAMTGWRIGWAAAPEEIARALVKLQGQTTSGASSIAQKAAEAAYTGPQECVAEMREAFARRRRLVMELSAEVKGWKVTPPDGAFYLFPDVTALLGRRVGGKAIATSADYTAYLLEEAHVAVVDGSAFRAPGHIRLSFAASDETLRRAMERISAATARL